jgi:hypothetical protein
MKKNYFLLVVAFALLIFSSCTPPNCVTSGFSPANNGTASCGPVTLSWPSIINAVSYDVYFDAGTTASTRVSVAQTGTSYTTASLGPGTYTWKVIPNGWLSSATGCSSYTFTIAAASPPTATISANIPDTLCAGTPILFTSTITNGGSTPVYKWFVNGVPVNGSRPTFTLYNPSKNDSVRLEMTSSITGGCTTTTLAISNKLTVNSYIISTPDVVATVVGDTVSCNGGLVTLSTTAAGAYQWQVNGGDWPGATQSSFTTGMSGRWTVKVTTPSGRCPAISNGINVNLSALPVPQITKTGTTLSTTVSYPTYQWYRNNVAITPGGNGPTYTYTRDGMYRVTVTNHAGCSGTSSSFPVNNLSTGTVVTTERLAIYPNPATGLITVNTTVPLHIAILDMEGRLVMRKENTNSIDVAAIANGIYFIQLRDKNDQVLKTEKLLKQ